MPRPKKTDAPDITQRCELTAGVIERLACPPGRSQVFLRDTRAPALRVRVTPAGAKSFVFERSLNNKTIRITLGAVSDWTIEQARIEARELTVLVDKGTDPRELERQRQAEKAAAAHAAEVAAEQARQRLAEMVAAEAVRAESARVTWERYLAARRPRWRERTLDDHVRVAQIGGQTKVRGEGLTRPGPLAPLLALPLAELTPTAVEAWVAKEANARPARVRLSLRMLKAFLRWAAAEPDLAERVDASAASGRKARDAAGSSRPRKDVLLREQLPAWFSQVRALSNPVVSAYLQCLLVTGARREEMLRLKWSDINWVWKGLHLADKVDDDGRVIPMTPYVAYLLSGLPRVNEWVFASSRSVSLHPLHARRRDRYHLRQGTLAPAGPRVVASASGRLVEPASGHSRACAAAGIEGLTLHGLRRSFSSLTEWLEIPTGVVAQIMGHKPSATAEKHYKVRPLDLLRVHHERIERWMLEQAGVAFDYDAAVETRRASLAVIGN